MYVSNKQSVGMYSSWLLDDECECRWCFRSRSLATHLDAGSRCPLERAEACVGAAERMDKWKLAERV